MHSNIVVLIAAALCAMSADAGADPGKLKICRIGSTGEYIPRDKECIDTQAKCEQKGGVWLGSVSGRGRSIGCDLPTKDAGKTCSDSSQCESLCVARDLSNTNCNCYGRTIVPKGQQPDTCSFTGVNKGALAE
jgi:hypothetical protein